jgi:hypothetical protein
LEVRGMRRGERTREHEYVVDWELDEMSERPDEDEAGARRGLGGVEVRWEALRPEPPRPASSAGRREERG